MPNDTSGKSHIRNRDDLSLPPCPAGPSLEQRIMALESESCARARDKESNTPFLRQGEFWIVGINGLLLVATIVIACIYFGQLKQMTIATQATRNAVGVASQTLTETQSSNTAQKKLIEKSFQATIDNFHLDQRAWVGIDNIAGSPAKNEPFVVTAYVKNTGKTPAKNVRAWGHCEPRAEMPNVQYGCSTGLVSSSPRSSGLLNPGGTFLLTLNPSHGHPLQQELKETLESKKTFYVYGCATYDDVFNSTHWLTYCSHWDEHIKGYAPCAKYNDSGEGPPPK